MLSACLAAILLSPSAHAANAAWLGTSNGTWSTATNWSGSSIPGVGNTATFNGTGSGNTAIDVGTISLANITFDTSSAAAYTLGATPGNGSITFGNGSTTAVTMNSTVTNSEIINANLTLGNGTANTTTFTNNSTTGLLTLGGNITGGTGGTAAAKTVIFTGAGNTTVGGVIDKGGATSLALAKSGAGTLTLSGANTYTGTTTLSAGTLAYGANNATGSGNVTISGGGTLAMGSYNGTAGAVSVSTGNITGTGTLTSTSGFTVAGNATISASLAGSVGLAKTGAGGTLTLTGNNTYTGATTVAATSTVGIMNVNGASGALSGTSSLTINAFATFNLGDATNGLANRINPNASLTLGSDLGYGYLTVYRGSATSNNQTFTSLNVGAAGFGKLDAQGTTGGNATLTFSGANPYVRGIGGMVNMNNTAYLPVSFTNNATGTGNVANGILLGAVMNGKDFILVGTGNVTAVSYGNDTWSPGTYTNITTNGTYADATTAGLRINAPSKTVNLTGTNTIESGGIIAGSSATGTGSTISGGTIKTGVAGGDLWVYLYNSTTPLTIGSAIGDNGGSSLTVASIYQGHQPRHQLPLRLRRQHEHRHVQAGGLDRLLLVQRQ